MLQKGMKAVSYPKDNKWIDMVEQPAQEPAYQVGEIVNPYGSNIKIKQPAQEPDFWMKDMVLYYYKPDDTFKYTPLYTHPAPAQNEFARTKSWQGLTNEEVFVIIYNNLKTWNTFEGISKFIDVIEQALRNKNGS